MFDSKLSCCPQCISQNQCHFCKSAKDMLIPTNGNFVYYAYHVPLEPLFLLGNLIYKGTNKFQSVHEQLC